MVTAASPSPSQIQETHNMIVKMNQCQTLRKSGRMMQIRVQMKVTVSRPRLCLVQKTVRHWVKFHEISMANGLSFQE